MRSLSSGRNLNRQRRSLSNGHSLNHRLRSPNGRSRQLRTRRRRTTMASATGIANRTP
jgi:hypothetical protein